MKKPNFLNKLTIIDYIIIIVIILVACIAILHISPGSNESDSSSYDASTFDKVTQKYLSFYSEGEIVKTTIKGVNASSGEEVTVHGTILWCDNSYDNKNMRVLVNDNGKKILGGTYDNNPDGDIYINQMTLEVDGSKVKNITEIKINPISITSFNELNKGLENYTNYEISTKISINDLNIVSYQNIENQEFNITKKPCMTIFNNKQLKIVRANNEDLKIADQNYKSFEGKTSPITIRIYNCTNEELNIIKSNYNIINIKHI
ncbi:hypothetical protein BGI41_06180 [Methanobrevibacter sp. 87.7]|uniref:adhesin n=1 Tax=Methanobrevibacter sp. 87.7 TaxID=387957 RepID=UPI000B510B9E|nr:adhesin [Methanobrevibacter sp. 87.7]OWT32725.1 hypothetical protein BGI41_06180 [Methanobrevibacter sp. 87.7]